MPSMKDINLDGVEFNVLPSGLHLVERDTMYVLLHPDTMSSSFSRLDTSPTPPSLAWPFTVADLRSHSVTVVSASHRLVFLSTRHSDRDHGCI